MHQARLFMNKWELRGPKNIKRNVGEIRIWHDGHPQLHMEVMRYVVHALGHERKEKINGGYSMNRPFAVLESKSHVEHWVNVNGQLQRGYCPLDLVLHTLCKGEGGSFFYHFSKIHMALN